MNSELNCRCWYKQVSLDLWKISTGEREVLSKQKREISLPRFDDRWPIWPIQVGFTALLPLIVTVGFPELLLSPRVHVKCINFLSVSSLTSSDHDVLTMVRPTWSLLAFLPHCLMSSAGPSGSWIRRGGGFLPRSITDSDHVAIKHTAAAAWLSCLISETDSSLFFVFKFQLIFWFVCQVVVMCLGVLTPL